MRGMQFDGIEADPHGALGGRDESSCTSAMSAALISRGTGQSDPKGMAEGAIVSHPPDAGPSG